MAYNPSKGRGEKKKRVPLKKRKSVQFVNQEERKGEGSIAGYLSVYFSCPAKKKVRGVRLRLMGGVCGQGKRKSGRAAISRLFMLEGEGKKKKRKREQRDLCKSERSFRKLRREEGGKTVVAILFADYGREGGKKKRRWGPLVGHWRKGGGGKSREQPPRSPFSDALIEPTSWRTGIIFEKARKERENCSHVKQCRNAGQREGERMFTLSKATGKGGR